MRNFVSCYSEARDKYKDGAGNPANHDRAMAERLMLTDGREAWVAAVADGCGGDDRGTRVAQLAIDRLREAVKRADSKTLSHSGSAGRWADELGSSLQSEVMNSGLKGGNSTLCAGIVVEDADEIGSYRILMINVGDSRARLFSGKTLELRGIVPHAPEANPNTSENGKSLCRAVGLVSRGNFPFFDVEVTLVESTIIPFVLVICSDGVDSYSSVATVNGKPAVRENTLLYPREFKKIIADGVNDFEEIPKQLLDRSLLNANAAGFAKLDNSTVAMVGIQISPGCISLPKDINDPLPVPKRRVVEEVASTPVVAKAAVGRSIEAARKGATKATPNVVEAKTGNKRPEKKPLLVVVAGLLLCALVGLYFLTAGGDGSEGASTQTTSSGPAIYSSGRTSKFESTLKTGGRKGAPEEACLAQTNEVAKEVKTKESSTSSVTMAGSESETNKVATAKADAKSKAERCVETSTEVATSESKDVAVVPWPESVTTDWERAFYRCCDAIDEISRGDSSSFSKNDEKISKRVLKFFRDKEAKRIAEHYNNCKDDLCSHCEKFRDYMKEKMKTIMDEEDAFYAMIAHVIDLIGEKESEDVIESIKKCLAMDAQI